MVLFLNGPVQNGDFTFACTPGKAVGIRLASALNNILGRDEAPHLWNTATLSGDIRYRAQDRPHPPSRAAFEHARLTDKYGPGMPQPTSVITDADPGVAELALTIVDEHLANGVLRIGAANVQECAGCGHTVGLGARRCTSCTNECLRVRSTRHLIKDNGAGQATSASELLHMRNRRRQHHLDEISRHVPHRLLLSRPRSHGVRLDALGLHGHVLDPRAGLHVTALFATQRQGAELAAMTVTPNALVHIAAYASGFVDHHGHRLRYALHGRVPYDAVPALQRVYDFHRADDSDRRVFESWFLPLLALRNKNRTHPGQLPALVKYFLKVRRAEPRIDQDETAERLREKITMGDPDWVMDKHLLAAALNRHERLMSRV